VTQSLSGAQRTALERLVQRARRWTEDDLSTTLSGRFGIDADGGVQPLESLALTNAGIAVRDDLLEIVDHLRGEGETPAGAIARLVREGAFTHLNRLFAVRIAEAVGLLPETTARGIASAGFRDFTEVAPNVATTDWGRFAVFVRLCGDELASDVPTLFDPRHPLLPISLTESTLERVITAMSDVSEAVWAAPDTLGWVYQFFNTTEERRAMREASPAPRDARELAVRNQFFTPSYVVDFLVHNGLGAYLAAAYPGLFDDLVMLIDRPTHRREIDLAAVSVLDPACGSGHFLLGAYDVLERAWQHAGVEPTDAAPAIVASLWGVDIDPRVTQIAQAAIVFRARRHRPDGPLPTPNVICARSLPEGAHVDELIESLPAHVARAVRAVAASLADAPELGPLLKVEERLSREVRDVFATGVVAGTLAEGAEHEETEAAILAALRAVADRTTASAGDRLFAAEAHDAVRFVEAMSRRYTAVLMNPPFGDPVPSTRERLKLLYPANSTRTADLFASFVDRGRSLTHEGGSLGAITTRAGLFLQSYETWRAEVFLRNGSVVLADLGFGVMEQAMVEACAYVLREPGRTSGTLTVSSVLDATDRPAALQQAIEDDRHGRPSRIERLPIDRLRAIPGSRVAYWAGEVIGAMFEKLAALDGGDVVVRRGLQTGDDFRFLRLDWEVGEDVASRTRWRPYAKGGPYRPYLPELHMLTDWDADGAVIKGFDGSIVPSSQFYFQPGATWTYRTNSAFSPRLMQTGVIFGNKGPGIIGGDPLWCVAYLNSRPAQACIETMVAAGETTTSGSASRSYDTGLVGLVPVPSRVPAIAAPVDRLWSSLLAFSRATAWRQEPLRGAAFDPDPFAGVAKDAMEAVVGQCEHDEIDAATAVVSAVDALDEVLVTVVSDEAAVDQNQLAQVLDITVGRAQSTYTGEARSTALASLWELDLDEAIDELIRAHGGSRNVANLTFHAHRRLEVLSHGLGVPPQAIATAVRELGLVSPEHRDNVSECLLSWLVGRCFGRVDAQPSYVTPDDLFVIPDMVGRVADAPDLLLDQPGHPLDLGDRFASAVEALDLDGAVGYALAHLAKGVAPRTYLRRDFFKQHVARYSMSRRKAPIYWQLQVPSKSWGIWLYYPRLTRELLFAIVAESEQRLRLGEQQIAHLQREAESASGREASELVSALDRERKLVVELGIFRLEAERIANLGWEPDLNDGAVLNAAALANLFPAWKDAASARKELRAGKHEWSTVSRYADLLL